MVILFLWVCSSTSQRQHPAEYPSRAARSSTLQTHRLPRIGNLFQWCHIGFRGSATSSAQTSASLHPPAALRLRVLPFTRDMVVHGLCGRVPDSAGSIICHPAAAPWPGDSLITHRISAPRPCDSLIRRRYVGGVGNRCRWADRFAMSEQRLKAAVTGMGIYMNKCSERPYAAAAS